MEQYAGNLILVRGVPGSGKSLFSQIICSHDAGYRDRKYTAHVSTDTFFTDEYGIYNYDPAKLVENHAKCQKHVEDMMKHTNRVINYNVPYERYCDCMFVHNTFTKKWEMDPYYELADKYDWRVFTIIVENRHNGRTVHGVPEETIKDMKDRFEMVL